jgi:hypothetical protein
LLKLLHVRLVDYRRFFQSELDRLLGRPGYIQRPLARVREGQDVLVGCFVQAARVLGEIRAAAATATGSA